MTIELGLQRISKLLTKHVEPVSWRAIHVAGTNGKGTVCWYVSEMLNAYNRSSYRQKRNYPEVRHGRFTSPHLVDRWDCITRNNATSSKMVSIDGEHFRTIEASFREFDRRHNINASNFEILTATAFESFKDLDIGVVEVGLGGRLDATNVFGRALSNEDESQPCVTFPPPLVTTITRIGLDHQEFLGSTHRDIAREKAGIMRPGVPAIWLPSNIDSNANSELESQALDLGAQIVQPDNLAACSDGSTRFLSSVQISNGKLAIASTVTALTGLGRLEEESCSGSISENDLVDLVRTWWEIVREYVFPGRQEWFWFPKVNVLLDGAHNTQGIAALQETVDQVCRRPRRNGTTSESASPVNWVIAISDSKDRDTAEMLRPLLRQGDTVHAVEFGPVDGMPWVKPKPSEDVASTAHQLVSDLKVDHGRSVREALKLALREAYRDGGDVVICGSLYLAGDVHRLLRDRVF